MIKVTVLNKSLFEDNHITKDLIAFLDQNLEFNEKNLLGYFAGNRLAMTLFLSEAMYDRYIKIEYKRVQGRRRCN